MTDLFANRDWLELFESFVEQLRIPSKEISASDIGSSTGGVPLELWGSQRRYMKEIASGLGTGQRYFVCLKNRQAGVSTVSLAIDLFWLAMFPGLPGVLVTDTDANRMKFRSLLQAYVASFPPKFFGSSFAIKKGYNNKEGMAFTNGSSLDLLVAGKRVNKTLGEGRGYALAHLCLAPGTPVIVEHGFIKPIEEVQVGDVVLTHTGARTRVIDVLGQPNTKGPMIRISPWKGHPILCTSEHTIPTARGIIEAHEVRKDDLLIMPLREIREDITAITLSTTAAVGHKNTTSPGWIRREGTGSGVTVQLTEEFGFAVGYYLAEGNVKKGPSGPCAVTFARHRSEKHYADRAIKALSEVITTRRYTVDRAGLLTTTDTVYGTPLARWLNDTFGGPFKKFIPDDVFFWGTAFCKGLLAGVLCGDGSKGIPTAGSSKKHKTKGKRYALNYVVLPTISSSLAMQLRDIAASLGYGWAGVRYEPPGNKNGRLCKAQWRLMWGGEDAARLRPLMGLEALPRNGRDYVRKYEIKDGLVYLKIKSIETGFDEPEMWDISVEHDDHTFRTPYASVGNTEVANYGSEEGIRSFIETLAEHHPQRLFMLESTAKGYNHWKTMCEEAQRDKITKRFFFIGWWAKELNAVSPKGPPPQPQLYREYGLYPPTPEESEKMKLVLKKHGHAVTQEQLAWYRWRASDGAGTTQDLHQNQPWTADEAFVLSGYSFFQVRLIQQYMQAIHEYDNGEGERPGLRFRGYRFHLGENFFHSKMEQVTTLDQVTLRIWDEPDEHGTYVLGCDPALGRNEKRDRHCVSVWRCYADRLEQVAEYADNMIDTRQCAWVLAYLAGAYRASCINIEISGGYGYAVLSELKNVRQLINSEVYADSVRDLQWEDFMAQARYFIYRKYDNMNASGGITNFKTHQDIKFEVMNQFRDSMATRALIIKSIPLCEELLSIQQNEGSIEAPDPSHDDRAYAAVLANRTWIDMVRPGLIAMNATYDRVHAGQLNEETKVEGFANKLVENFFKRADQLALEPKSTVPRWMIERGLAS